MAKGTIQMDCRVTKICLIFFPIATLTIVGDIGLLTVFGVPVYRRVGDVREFLGMVIK